MLILLCGQLTWVSAAQTTLISRRLGAELVDMIGVEHEAAILGQVAGHLVVFYTKKVKSEEMR